MGKTRLSRFPRWPLFRTYYFFSDAEGIPEEFQVECHGVKLAYNIPERLLARLQSSVLDFDGETVRIH